MRLRLVDEIEEIKRFLVVRVIGGYDSFAANRRNTNPAAPPAVPCPIDHVLVSENKVDDGADGGNDAAADVEPLEQLSDAVLKDGDAAGLPVANQ